MRVKLITTEYFTKFIITEYFTVLVKWPLGHLAPNRNPRLGYKGINLTGTGST